MNDGEQDGEDRVHGRSGFAGGFLANFPWSFLDFGPNSFAFLTNRTDMTDFRPGMCEEDYQVLVDAINQRSRIAMQTLRVRQNLPNAGAHP